MHKTTTLHIPHNQKPQRQILQKNKQNKKKNTNTRRKIKDNEETITKLKAQSKGLKGNAPLKDKKRKNRIKKKKEIRKRQQKIQKRTKRTGKNQRKNIQHLRYRHKKRSNKKI